VNLKNKLSSVMEVQERSDEAIANCENIDQNYQNTNSAKFESEIKTISIMMSSYSKRKLGLEKFDPMMNNAANVQNQVSDKKSVFYKIDINSISVRKFNLDVCEDNQVENGVFDKNPIDLKRVCLPIFTLDILESLNCLDINSSVGKLSCHSHYCSPEADGRQFESGQKIVSQENNQDQEM